MGVLISNPDLLWDLIDTSQYSPGGCWEWQGYIHPTGYGIVRWKCLTESRAHRAAYALANGPITGDEHVLHLCDNRRCCNPDHLILGDNDLNVKHKLDRGRGADVSGSNNPRSRLNETEVAIIKGRLNAEHKPWIHSGLLERIANDYGVAHSTISAIATGRNWGHIEPINV